MWPDVNLNSLGLALDMVAAALLALSSVRVDRNGDGYLMLLAVIENKRYRDRVHWIGWLLLFVGFALQLIG